MDTSIPDLSMAISAIIACIQFALLAVSFAICWYVTKYLIGRSNGKQLYETPSRKVRILLLFIAWAVTLVAGVILAGTGAFSGIFHYQVLDSRNITCIIAFFPDGLLQLTLGGGSWGKFLFDLGTGGRTNCLDPQILSRGLARSPFPLIFYIGVWLSYIGLVVGALTARQRKSFLVIFATLSLLLTLNALGWQDYGSYIIGK